MKSRSPNHSRRGATAVEFALVFPMLFLFVFGALEFSGANMLRNTIENAAFEGARQAIIPGATASEAPIAAQSLLNILNIQDSTVTISPATIDINTESVTVTVIAPMTLANHYVMPKFFLGETLTASITLPCER